MKRLGMYIHIPFCKSKCFYCDFSSWAKKEDTIEEYIKWLKVEIEEVANGIRLEHKEVEIGTIYIGGGTPSHINSKYIIEILQLIRKCYQVADDAEVTIEINPGTVNCEKLADYERAGVNRLSIGLQSTHDEMLKKIGRIHTYEEFLNTYELARKANFKNINVDLILALPRRR